MWAVAEQHPDVVRSADRARRRRSRAIARAAPHGPDRRPLRRSEQHQADVGRDGSRRLHAAAVCGAGRRRRVGRAPAPRRRERQRPRAERRDRAGRSPRTAGTARSRRCCSRTAPNPNAAGAGYQRCTPRCCAAIVDLVKALLAHGAESQRAAREGDAEPLLQQGLRVQRGAGRRHAARGWRPATARAR